MKLIATIAAVPAVALATAAPAQADQYDYVMLLDNEGVYYDSISDVIDAGKMTCRMMRGGNGVDSAVSYIMTGGHPAYEAGIVVYAASSTMCPDTLPLLQAYIGGSPGTAA